MRTALLPPEPFLSLTETKREFDRWRRTRPRGERIPAALWQAAADLARRHGVSSTSMALSLDYYALQRRVGGGAREHAAETAAEPEFVELALPATRAATSSCRVELRDAAGAPVRLDLSGWSAPDLATFVRAIAGRRS